MSQSAAPLRPTHLVVSLGQLRRNVEAIRERVTPAKVLVMLKANAYGHGVDGVAPYIEPYVDYLGVATLAEGIHLRELGVRKPVLVAGEALPAEIPWYLKNDLSLTTGLPEVLRIADRLSGSAGKNLKVHLKVDTGMERFGVQWDEATPLLDVSLAQEHLDIEGIYTHFANAEVAGAAGERPSPGFVRADEQLERFSRVLGYYEERGIPPPRLRHAANSAAVLNLPGSYFDMVRVGIMFYGVNPAAQADPIVEVRPALTWSSQVSFSKITPAGRAVSYGSLWQSDQSTRLVTIPCGYGDGYFRRMSNSARILVDGRSHPQVGRICMDYFMVNMEDGPAAVGEQVILLGESASGEKITAEDLAGWAGTNVYEVLTNISARVPRVFIED